jgi:hypothetical protein
VLLQVFGFGPDETAHFRLVLFKVPVLDAVVSSLLQVNTICSFGMGYTPDRVLVVIVDLYHASCRGDCPRLLQLVLAGHLLVLDLSTTEHNIFLACPGNIRLSTCLLQLTSTLAAHARTLLTAVFVSVYVCTCRPCSSRS